MPADGLSFASSIIPKKLAIQMLTAIGGISSIWTMKTPNVRIAAGTNHSYNKLTSESFQNLALLISNQWLKNNYWFKFSHKLQHKL